METTTTSRYQTFVEEPFMTSFAPARQIGLNATKYGEKYLLVGGIHFNDVENLEVTTYTEDDNKANGTDEGYSLTGKGVFRPINNDNNRISMRDMTSISRKKYLDTDDITNVESYTLLAGELSAAHKNMRFSSEYIQTNVTREGELGTFKASGMYAAVSYLIFGGKYNYNDEEGEFAQVSRGKEWGDVEVAFRYDYVNLNDKWCYLPCKPQRKIHVELFLHQPRPLC